MKECTWEEVCREVKEVGITDAKLSQANIVLFGNGWNGRIEYERLKQSHRILAFTDNDSEKWGGYSSGTDNIEIINPAKLLEIDNLIVLITVSVRFFDDIKRKLDSMQIESYSYIDYAIAKNFDKISEVYNSILDDGESKRVYRNILMANLKKDIGYMMSVYTRNQYFDLPQFMCVTNKEVFVDCGAWCGDTVEQFVMTRGGQFKSIYAFEPEDKLYAALQARCNRLCIENALKKDSIITVKGAVSEGDGSVAFTVNQVCTVSSRIVKESDKNAEVISAVSLDSYFKNIDKPTFIKADIEGAEADMIRGAKNIIAENKPLMAVCIYHRIEDLFELPMMIKEINPTYKMSIRHHTPQDSETVLYCY